LYNNPERLENNPDKQFRNRKNPEIPDPKKTLFLMRAKKMSVHRIGKGCPPGGAVSIAAIFASLFF
jgi:hypothetical protein